jgi:hypothetical protein
MSVQELDRHQRIDADHCVMSFLEWCSLNGISKSTGRRILESGTGPVFLQLSPRRIGVTVAANKAWQQSLARSVV